MPISNALAGIKNLSQLTIDAIKDWAGMRIDNVGAPNTSDDVPRARAGDILADRFGLDRMPAGATVGEVLTAQGAGISPAYAAVAAVIKTYIPTLTNLNNSVAETNVIAVTIPANDIADGDIIEFVFSLLWKQNTGVAQTATVKCVYGASSVILINAVAVSDNATEGRAWQRLVAQRVGANLYVSTSLKAAYFTPYGFGGWAIDGHWGTNEAARAGISGVIAAPGFAADKTLALSFTLSIASASFYVHPEVAKVYKIG